MKLDKFYWPPQRCQKLIDTLVGEGIKRGKVLWCCCSWHENEARIILNEQHGIYEEETENERTERYKTEAVR